MTEEEIISQLALAVGYALDAGNNNRTDSFRDEARRRSEKILEEIIQQLPDSKELKDTED